MIFFIFALLLAGSYASCTPNCTHQTSCAYSDGCGGVCPCSWVVAKFWPEYNCLTAPSSRAQPVMIQVLAFVNISSSHLPEFFNGSCFNVTHEMEKMGEPIGIPLTCQATTTSGTTMPLLPDGGLFVKKCGNSQCTIVATDGPIGNWYAPNTCSRIVAMTYGLASSMIPNGYPVLTPYPVTTKITTNSSHIFFTTYNSSNCSAPILHGIQGTATHLKGACEVVVVNDTYAKFQIVCNPVCTSVTCGGSDGCGGVCMNNCYMHTEQFKYFNCTGELRYDSVILTSTIGTNCQAQTCSAGSRITCLTSPPTFNYLTNANYMTTISYASSPCAAGSLVNGLAVKKGCNYGIFANCSDTAHFVIKRFSGAPFCNGTATAFAPDVPTSIPAGMTCQNLTTMGYGYVSSTSCAPHVSPSPSPSHHPSPSPSPSPSHHSSSVVDACSAHNIVTCVLDSNCHWCSGVCTTTTCSDASTIVLNLALLLASLILLAF